MKKFLLPCVILLLVIGLIGIAMAVMSNFTGPRCPSESEFGQLQHATTNSNPLRMNCEYQNDDGNVVIIHVQGPPYVSFSTADEAWQSWRERAEPSDSYGDRFQEFDSNTFYEYDVRQTHTRQTVYARRGNNLCSAQHQAYVIPLDRGIDVDGTLRDVLERFCAP